MEKYNSIIWDLDGTLLDTLDDLRDSVNAALTKFHLPTKTKMEVRRFLGNGMLALVERSVPDGQQHPQFQDIYSFFELHYSKNSRNKTRPYKGLEKVLPELKALGYHMAIVSNKADVLVKELAEYYFRDVISVAIGESKGIRRKPCPDTALEAMRLLHAEKASSVYIGDSEVDIKTAENAGIDCLSVSWGFRNKSDLQASGASRIVDTPAELLEILKG